MKALLLAGGKGTRLWPLSKENTPKQVLSPLNQRESLLEMTFARVRDLGFDVEDIYLITNTDQLNFINPLWSQLSDNPIIDEPIARNTGPAVFLGVKYLLDQGLLARSEQIFIFPSDHYMNGCTLDLSVSLDDKILCYGIQPTYPETGYGYIQAFCGKDLQKVLRFEEKPDQRRADQFFNTWSDQSSDVRYFWNSGIYAFSIDSLTVAAQRFSQDFSQQWEKTTFHQFKEYYANVSSLSFDKMIAERADNLYVEMLSTISWRDIGSWESVYDTMALSSDDNVHIGLGQQIAIASQRCLTYTDKNINIACAGVDDLVIIISGDTILISRKGDPESRYDLYSCIQKDHEYLL